MPKPNTSFLLSIDDVDLIEDALRDQKKRLSMRRLQVVSAKAGPKTEGALVKKLDGDMRRIHELLGSLHNQKIFYRPSGMAYVGG